MCLPLFNPPCPGGDPIESAFFGSQQPACGQCTGVPKYWEVIAEPGGVTQPGSPNSYTALYMGRTILIRDLSGLSYGPLAPCRWQSVLTSFAAIGTPDDAANFWELRYDAAADALAGFPRGRWYVIANGLSNLGSPRDGVVYSQLLNPFDPVAKVIPQFFKCLEPNLFTWDPSLGTNIGLPGMPVSITVQPFWP